MLFDLLSARLQGQGRLEKRGRSEINKREDDVVYEYTRAKAAGGEYGRKMMVRRGRLEIYLLGRLGGRGGDLTATG